MNIAGIVFLTLGILFIVIPGIVALAKRDATPMFFSLYSLIWFFLFPLVNYPNPISSDVRDGKAVYIKEKHISIDQNGDTLYNYTTYHLEWLPEWEYGRKH